MKELAKEQLICDVCGSNDIKEYPHMGINCNCCNPINKPTKTN